MVVDYYLKLEPKHRNYTTFAQRFFYFFKRTLCQNESFNFKADWICYCKLGSAALVKLLVWEILANSFEQEGFLCFTDN